MMKFTYLASVVLLGAGMAVAQCSAPSATNSTASSVSATDNTPSAINPQTNSPDSIARFNPVTGQNADSQRNPNAMASDTGNSTTNANGQSATNAPASNATVTQDPHDANTAVVNTDSTPDTYVIVVPDDDESGSQE